MKQPTFNSRVLLPMDVIEAARAGDPLAVERVLRYYEGYINKLCTRTLYDKNGLPYIDVDEYMKHRLQAKLVEAIVVRK
ncbi:MAG: helix-turn-helix domain-containing protein [Clostridiales bacterium]|nr:helix-turn-helix domain-containing protein [Clostridiales bacterium]